MRGQGIENKIEGGDGIVRSPANTASQNKIQRKIGAASPKVIIEKHHWPVLNIVQHTRGGSKRHQSASEVETSQVRFSLQCEDEMLRCERPTRTLCAQCAVAAGQRPGKEA
jgi:hypothetical protein